MFENLTLWWDSLSVFQQTYAILAFIGGSIFVIQSILTFFGSDVDGADSSFVGQFGVSDYAFKFFSLQSISSFLLIGGLIGLWIDGFGNHIYSVIAALSAGFLMSFLVQKLIKKMLALQSDGNIKLTDAIGKTGKVYLRIPVKGEGQIEFDFQDRRLYHKAISKDELELVTGSRVKILSVTSDNVLVVEKV